MREARVSRLRLVPGYTVLVIDTNILLSSLFMFSSLVETMQWTVLVPLAVITELDGIAKNASELGNAATAAIDYISSHIRSRGRPSESAAGIFVFYLLIFTALTYNI